MKKEIISHDGLPLKKGMRVSWSDNSGFLTDGVVIGFRRGCARVKLDSGGTIERGGVSFYIRKS